MFSKELKMNLQYFADIEDGVNEPEPAEPAEGVTEEDGVNEPEPAEPAQSVDENAKYAAARRAAEEEHNRQMADLNSKFAERFAGYANPLTGENVTDIESYFRALDAQKQIQTQEQLKSQGIDPALLDRAIQSNPIIKQAEEVLAKQKEAEEQKQIQSEIDEISKLDASIKSPEDLLKMENFEQFRGYVSKGYTFVDAFKLSNFSKLQQTGVDAAKQAAINQAKGTSHMQSTQAANVDNGLVDIPVNELAAWKEYYPDLSLSELTKKYNATL